jgi:DNA-binding MurR/RpiR family transcriptional regulator
MRRTLRQLSSAQLADVLDMLDEARTITLHELQGRPDATPQDHQATN